MNEGKLPAAVQGKTLEQAYEENAKWGQQVEARLQSLGEALTKANIALLRGGEREHRIAAFVVAIDGCAEFVASFEEFRERRLDASLRELLWNLRDLAINGILPDDFEGKAAKGSTERAKVLRLHCSIAMGLYMEGGLSQADAAQRVATKMRSNKGITAARVKEWRDQLSRGRDAAPDPLYSEIYHRLKTSLRREGQREPNVQGLDTLLESVSVRFKSVKLKDIRRA
jgi:hypothetical protein